MADSKYGRIFTAEDVMKIMAHENHPGFPTGTSSEEGVQLETIIAEGERDGIEFRFPADEPLFVLRGQDQLASDGIMMYGGVCAANDASIHHIEAVDKAWRQFVGFAEKNPDRMKLPD